MQCVYTVQSTDLSEMLRGLVVHYTKKKNVVIIPTNSGSSNYNIMFDNF